MGKNQILHFRPTTQNAAKQRKIPHLTSRPLFWRYCKLAAIQAELRAQAKGLPYDIDAHYIDTLLVDQEWCCAISGAPLQPGRGRHPFGPHLDRLEPELGYMRGNLRVVCAIVNLAMQEWGLDPLLTLVNAIAARAPLPPCGTPDQYGWSCCGYPEDCRRRRAEHPPEREGLSGGCSGR